MFYARVKLMMDPFGLEALLILLLVFNIFIKVQTINPMPNAAIGNYYKELPSKRAVKKAN
jgi:hypothetical protein